MRATLAGISLALALVVSGCGGGSSPGTTTTTASGNGMASKSPVQVLAATVKAAESASSFRMNGNVSSGSQPIGIDLSIEKDKGATGSMTLKGHKVNLVVVDGSGYLQGNGAFWKQFGGAAGATIAQLLQGKWLKFPVNNSQFKPLIAFSSAKAIFEQIKSGSTAQVKNAGMTTYKGQSVVALKDGPKNGTLYVSAVGTPYPVAIVRTGSNAGSIAFSEWNQPVTLTAPTDVLDFSKLTGG